MPPFGRVTTSVMIEFILRTLSDLGCTYITIGEGTVPNEELGSSTFRGFDWTGIAKVAKRYGAK